MKNIWRRFWQQFFSQHKTAARGRKRLGSRQILLLATAFCVLLIALSLFRSSSFAPLRAIAGYTIVPMEKGISRIGNWLSNQRDNFRSLQEVESAYEEALKELESLKATNEKLAQDAEALSRLEELYALDAAYPDYETTAANVIGKDSGNWFHVFTIDKGTQDGIETDMNVIAGGGLVGIVTETGANWATVRAIIDDGVQVSAMTEKTSDICYVSGDLSQINEGTLPFTDMKNNENEVGVGDKLVTSTVSSKYLPGITIGYIHEIHVDTNNLTRSGTVTPAADFEHLREVLVILETKGEQPS